MSGSRMICGVLFDLSGVLYVGEQVLPGALDALGRLRAQRMPVRFVTNVTRSPARKILARLNGMGLAIQARDLFTAPIAAREYLQAHDLRPFSLIHPDLEGEFSDLPKVRPNAVLLGDAGISFSYRNLNKAFRLLMEGAPLLAMGNNRYFREPDGLSLDVGPFLAALEYASGVHPMVFGKPSRDFFATAVASLRCAPSLVVMDDAWTDVEGAIASGLQGVLVQTGKYRPGDEGRIRLPGAILVADAAAAVDWILAAR
jgi:HAD superfamily hydrolase (TIGR01458 family)